MTVFLFLLMNILLPIVLCIVYSRNPAKQKQNFILTKSTWYVLYAIITANYLWDVKSSLVIGLAVILAIFEGLPPILIAILRTKRIWIPHWIVSQVGTHYRWGAGRTLWTDAFTACFAWFCRSCTRTDWRGSFCTLFCTGAARWGLSQPISICVFASRRRAPIDSRILLTKSCWARLGMARACPSKCCSNELISQWRRRCCTTFVERSFKLSRKTGASSSFSLSLCRAGALSKSCITSFGSVW